jgi:MarR family transcriptional regulator, organic hydroperoxide resistance regulator
VRDQFKDGGIVLENALAYWVARFYEAARREMYRAFREHGFEVTPEQWMVLVRLWEQDAQTQSELCAITHRDAPTMSRILASMRSRGLVRTATDEEDKRTRRVSLTPKARAARRTLVPVVESLVARFESQVTERDLETTRRTLRTLVTALEA